jgi:hypothetical protein
MSVHLGKKVGQTILSRWPVAAADVAPLHDTTLIHLKERNAFIPVHNDDTPLAQPIIDAYALELLADQYSTKVTNDFQTKLSASPSVVYLDPWAATVRSGPEDLVYPAQDIPRSWAAVSSGAKRIVERLTNWQKRFSGLRRSLIGASGAVDTSLAADPIPIGTFDESLAQFVPPEAVLYELDQAIFAASNRPEIPGSVLLKIYYNNTGGVDPRVTGTYYFYAVFPEGSNLGWSREVIDIRFYNEISTTGNLFGWSVSFDETLGIDLVTNVGQRWVYDEEGAPLGQLQYFTVYDQFTAATNNGAVAAAGNSGLTWPAGWTEGSIPAVYSEAADLLIAAAPIELPLIRAIGKYFASCLGDYGISDRTAELLWAEAVNGAALGVDPPVGLLNIGPTPASIVPHAVARDGVLYKIGHTFSVDRPGGTPMPIENIFEDVYTSSKDGRPVSVIACNRKVTDARSNSSQVYASKTITTSDMADFLELMASKPGWPAALDLATRTELAAVPMALFFVPKIPIASFTFENSAFNGQAVDGYALTANTCYVGEDAEGALQLFADAVLELDENGFFDDLSSTTILLPLTGTEPTSETVVVTLSDVDTPQYDLGTVSVDRFREMVVMQSPGITFSPNAGWTTNFYNLTPNANVYTTQWNELRLELGLDPLLESEVGKSDVTMNSLNPNIYLSPTTLQNSAGTYVQQALYIPVRSTRYDLSLIGRQIPKSAKLLYSMAIKVLIPYLDPL